MHVSSDPMPAAALARPAPQLARDVMTAAVVTVTPDTSVMAVARVLLDKRISAVPVVDAAGALVGMVSEGDLLGRSAEDRLAGQEWWLAILSREGQTAAAVTAAAVARPIRDVMQAPVVTVADDAPVHAVADLLRTHGIKRLPVMHEGRMVGIVTRADLLRVVEATPALGARQAGGVSAMLMGFFGGMGQGTGTARQPAPPAPVPPQAAVTAGAFRHLADVSHQSELDERKAAAHAVELERMRQVKAMLQDHVGAEMWETLLAHAQVAAAHGAKEMQLLRFPSELCGDSGRKINNADPAWAETLRGEAAEMYARWECDLKPAGFGIAARVVTYPEGKPGDVGLFLVWEN